MKHLKDKNLITHAEKMVREYFGRVSEPAGGKGYRVEHAQRIKKYLLVFLKHKELAGKDIDVTALLLAGLLHDIGDVKRMVNGSIDYSLDIDHAQEGAAIAHKELAKLTDDAELIDKIVNIILNHHNSGKDASIETKLVQDADQLDELGYVNFWQMFQYSYNKGRNLADTIAYWQREGIVRKQACVARCNFSFTKTMAKKRLAKMRSFINEITKEIGLTDV